MNLKEYLDEHTIVLIGRSYLCGEVIVDKPTELISVIEKCGYYISEIRWWDRAKIAVGSDIGYGGPRDPNDPDNYFFAETDIDRTFDTNTQSCVYRDYLSQIKNERPCYDIHPAFAIKRK